MKARSDPVWRRNARPSGLLNLSQLDKRVTGFDKHAAIVSPYHLTCRKRQEPWTETANAGVRV
jgi:hypothetical protein